MPQPPNTPADPIAAAFAFADFAAAIGRQAAEGLIQRHVPDTCGDRQTRFRFMDVDQKLDALRLRGDPDPKLTAIMDAVATDGGRTIPSWQNVFDFKVKLATDRRLDLKRFPKGAAYLPPLRQWASTIQLPPGTDKPRLRRAGKFFAPRLISIVMILGTSSLLEAYASGKGVHVLFQTKQLSKQTNRRLAESLAFVMDACEPNAYRPGGHGLDAIRKIRLMHECIRWEIEHYAIKLGKPRPPLWDPQVYGRPINGEDLLGMMLGFSRVITRDLPKIGEDVKPEDAEDYRYLWDVIGGLLGVEAELRPRTVDEAADLFCVIKRRQQTESSPDGIEMASALLDFYTHGIPLLPDDVKSWIKGFVVALSRSLVGDWVCDLVGFPPSYALEELVAIDAVAAIEVIGRAVLLQTGLYPGKLFGGVKPYKIPRSLQGALA